MDVKVRKQYNEGQRGEQMDGELKKWGDGVMCALIKGWVKDRKVQNGGVEDDQININDRWRK